MKPFLSMIAAMEMLELKEYHDLIELAISKAVTSEKKIYMHDHIEKLKLVEKEMKSRTQIEMFRS